MLEYIAVTHVHRNLVLTAVTVGKTYISGCSNIIIVATSINACDDFFETTYPVATAE